MVFVVALTRVLSQKGWELVAHGGEGEREGVGWFCHYHATPSGHLNDISMFRLLKKE